MTTTLDTVVPRRVLVVGGSKGVGRRVVEVLTARGSRCAIGYAHDEAAATNFAASFPIGSEAPVLARGDIADAAPSVVQQAVAGLGGLDAVAITAVPVITGRALSLTRDQFEQVAGVVMWGLLDTIRASVPHLEEAGG